MTTITTYSDFDTERLKDAFGIGLGFDGPTNVSSTQFTEKAAGFYGDNLIFLGNFTVSGSNISGGTITGLELVTSWGTKVAVVSGVNIPITSTGYSFSFSYGPFVSPGITYDDEGFGNYLNGYGNDTYYARSGTKIAPGGGVNTIYGADSGTIVYFSGASTQYAFSAGPSGSVWVIDSTATRNGYDNIFGSATLKFDGDNVQIQDNAGQLILWTPVGTAGQLGNFGSAVTVNVSDTAGNVAAGLDSLQTLVASGKVMWIALTDGGTPTLTVTEAQLTGDAAALKAIYTGYALDVTGVAVADAASVLATPSVKAIGITDSLAHVSAALDSLESSANAGKISSITLTDSGTANLSLSDTQFAADSAALGDMSGNFTVTVIAGSGTTSIQGLAGHATTVQFSGNASQYAVSSANGVVTVTSNGVTDHLSNISAIQFADGTEIVAAAPGTASAVTTGNVTELYSAVLAREPDVGGLSFYQNYLKANSGAPLMQFAEWFLSSSEYTSKHSYPQSTAGDTQFITDSYQNLLHRTPTADEVNFYLTNVIQKAVAGLTPGTQAYSSAEFQAHAQMLVYFSASSEFLGDVQINAQNSASAQHWLILT